MKKTNWTPQEDALLRAELDKKNTLKDIAYLLNRSEEAIYLYCFRHHIQLKEQIKNPLMRKMLTIKLGNPDLFKPNREFLLRVGIGQKRWYQLAAGYAQPTQLEMMKVAKELKFTVEEAFELMEARQLEIFE
ncbi:MAG: hypothetical protein ACRC3Z_07885 [Phocaeicola sp.]